MAVTVIKENENENGKFRIVMEERGANLLSVQRKTWWGWGSVFTIRNEGTVSINHALDFFDIALAGI